MRQVHALFVIALCCFSLSSISCGGEQCADCGPCGFVGGPEGQTGMRIGDVGRAESGNPAVELIFHSIENPSCEIEDEAGVVFDPEMATTTFDTDAPVVVSDEQEHASDGVYNWSEDGVELRVSTDNQTVASLRFFKDQQEVMVECTVDASERIMCE